MQKKIFNLKRLCCIAIFSFILSSCKKADTSTVPLSNEKLITSFSFTSLNNSILSNDIVASIDQINKRITAILPSGISLNNLKANFTISSKATVSVAGITQNNGVTSNNFSTSLIYVVKAQDNSTQEYTVTISNSPVVFEKLITSFSFSTINNPTLSSDIIATINQNTKTISATFPDGLPLTSLKASFTASANTSIIYSGVLQISGTTSNNFSNPMTFTVVAQDNTFQLYKFFATVNSSGANIYVGGHHSIGGSNYTRLWRNGASTNLVEDQFPSQVYEIFVSADNNTYAAGYHSNNNYTIAKIWKNGVASFLGDGTKNSYAYGVYVNNNDVYAAGDEWGTTGGIACTAKVWKNGVATNLTSGSTGGHATGLYVQNNDVYVCGFEEGPGGGPRLWKNGVEISLTGLSNSCRLKDVYVNGVDVYALGTDIDNITFLYKIVLWKNGIVTDITNGVNVAQADELFVTNNDVYILGIENNGVSTPYVPKYWKNGIPNIINYPGVSSADDIFVKDNDVYIAGTRFFVDPSTGTNYIAQVWKNGTAISVNATHNSAAKAIFVK